MRRAEVLSLHPAHDGRVGGGPHELVVIARTDARAGEGLEVAIARAKAYRDARVRT
jgi:2-methylisocitrate lyase-like PEP mutase family enzyme